MLTGLLLEWLPLGVAVASIALLYTLVTVLALFARPLDALGAGGLTDRPAPSAVG